ncbi:MAG: DUF115 domain-containing protein, partial [Treponema sp.]|nr:DUF115 domain-containing protein [Treponema sp.]
MGKKYVFLESKTKKIVPAIREGGENHALHSLFDPEREAARLLDAVKNKGFVIFLGLGGGFFVREALKRNISLVLVIDFDREGAAEIFAAVPDVLLGENGKKAHILIDPSNAEIERFILDHYHPVLMDGVQCLPLRPRTRVDATAFKDAEDAVAKAIEKVAVDFSVQSAFGLRWFSNILHNMKRLMANAATLADAEAPLPKVKHAAVVAAGPSLDGQIPLLRKFKETQGFVIAVDTAFPRLAREGVEPDAIISIDCQIWTYHHFRGRVPKNTLLLFALEGGVIDAGERIRFFAGGHPFSRYISRFVYPLPEIDASGGNVTYAAVSLAETLGAETTTLYGADFSYPFGKTYARGTWLYDFYGNRSNRFQSAETRFSDLLYRTPLEKKESPLKDGWYYETPALAMYRRRLEEKTWRTKLIPFPTAESGDAVYNASPEKNRASTSKESEEIRHDLQRASLSAPLRLNDYFEKVRALSFDNLDEESALILATILPIMTSFKRRKSDTSKEALLDMTKTFIKGIYFEEKERKREKSEEEGLTKRERYDILREDGRGRESVNIWQGEG